VSTHIDLSSPNAHAVACLRNALAIADDCGPIHGDNNRDTASKGRTARGSRNGATKLNPDLVRQIRARRMAGDSTNVLSRSFGVAKRAICAILNGETWKWVS
jgi:hypothetical protein